MKKIYFLFYLLTFGLTINANPIPISTIEISELYFDESDNWKLELGYFNFNPEGYTFDSIFLFSSMDTAKVPDYLLTGECGQFVLTVDSLTADFKVNRLGDTIKVISYGGGFEDILIFGNVSGASINSPRPGQSISKYDNSYVKDKSPSIGEFNDTTGMCGTLSGYIYDKFSNPVSNREFGLGFWTKTNNDGSYIVRVLSKPTIFNCISYKVGQNSYGQTRIEKVEYIMEPDSLIEVNIYLLDTLITDINNMVLENSPISIYPNPVPINKQLNIKIDLPIITSDIYIEIIDLNGKMIKKKKIIQNTSSITAPDKSGFYFVRTMLDSEIISSNSIIVNE